MVIESSPTERSRKEENCTILFLSFTGFAFPARDEVGRGRASIAPFNRGREGRGEGTPNIDENGSKKERMEEGEEASSDRH